MHIIFVGDEILAEFDVHKFVLASVSPVLHRQIQADMIEKKMAMTEIPDGRPGSVRMMKNFMYKAPLPDKVEV